MKKDNDNRANEKQYIDKIEALTKHAIKKNYNGLKRLSKNCNGKQGNA